MGKCYSKRGSKIKNGKRVTDRWKYFENGTYNIENHHGTINFYVGENEKLMKELTKRGDFINCLCKRINKCDEDIVDTGNNRTNPIEEQPKSEHNQNSALSYQNEDKFGQDLSSSDTFVSEDNLESVDRCQILQDGMDSNHSYVEMQVIKDVCPDFPENIDQSSGMNISEGFCEDVGKNVHDVQKRIRCQFLSEEMQRQYDDQNKNFDTKSRKPGSVNSRLHFSILSELRPRFPADGEANSQTYDIENLHNFDRSIDSSTQVKSIILRCSRNIHNIDGADSSNSVFTKYFSRTVTEYSNNSCYSSSIITSEDDKVSYSSDFFTNKKIDYAYEANSTTKDNVAVGKQRLGQKSLPLPSLDDSDKSISQSYRQSLEKQRCDEFIIIEDTDKGDIEMEIVTDSCQAHGNSYLTDVHKELTEKPESDDFDSQTDVHNELIEETESDGFDNQTDAYTELIEETESDGFDETFVVAIKKIVEAGFHITLTLRDISFLIYTNFITLKFLPGKTLNYVHMEVVHFEQFSITNFRYLYFHKALLAVDNMEMKYMQKSMKRRSSEHVVSDTTYTNKNNESGYNKNERSDLKNVHAVFLPDSAGEQMDAVECSVIEKSHAFIRDRTDICICGNTCVLLEHEEHAKKKFT